jgi:hypothetical protein
MTPWNSQISHHHPVVTFYTNEILVQRTYFCHLNMLLNPRIVFFFLSFFPKSCSGLGCAVAYLVNTFWKLGSQFLQTDIHVYIASKFKNGVWNSYKYLQIVKIIQKGDCLEMGLTVGSVGGTISHFRNVWVFWYRWWSFLVVRFLYSGCDEPPWSVRNRY